MAETCLHCYVSGRVQGVFYRRNTEVQANLLGVRGWVRNLDDGRVEVFLCGEKANVERLVEWLWEGPSGAMVKGVEVKEVAFEAHTEFLVK